MKQGLRYLLVILMASGSSLTQAHVFLQDQFTGTTIDPAKWAVNPGSGSIRQNDVMTMAGAGGWNDCYVLSVPAWDRASGGLPLQVTFDLDASAGSPFLAGLYPENADIRRRSL